jgi:hypothetical protein
MKFLLLSFIALSSLSAFAEGYDCREVGSPQGGKFCYYVVPECARANCEEAAACAVQQYANNVTWKDVKGLKVLKSKDVTEEDVVYSEVSVASLTDGQEVTNTVTLLPNKTRYDGAIVCEPVALKY